MGATCVCIPTWLSWVAQPSGLRLVYTAWLPSVHGGKAGPTFVGHSSNSVEVFILLCLPLHPSSLLQVNLQQKIAFYNSGYVFALLSFWASWKALTGRINVMAKFVLAINWGPSQIFFKIFHICLLKCCRCCLQQKFVKFVWPCLSLPKLCWLLMFVILRLP